MNQMYDFDTLIDRSTTGACKWVRRTEQEKKEGILALSVADMELPVAPCVREAVVHAAEHGIYGYTDPTDEYYDAVLSWMASRHGIQATAQNIVPISGVVAGLAIAIRAFSNPGDGIIIQTPVYSPFYSCIELNDRRIEHCPLTLNDSGYHMDFSALEQCAKKDDVHLMILCSPHNPVGRVWTKDELERLFAICRKNNVLVISDEIHADIVFHGTHHAFPTLSHDAHMYSITLTAPSKTFNVPGLQNANAFIFDETLLERFKMQARTDGFDNISYFGHAASIAAYTGAGDWLEAVKAYIYANYELLRDFLNANMPQARLFPLEGTYLAWIDFRYLSLTVEELSAFIRNDAKWILTEGYCFGTDGEGFERINLALPRAEFQKALDHFLIAYQNRF